MEPAKVRGEVARERSGEAGRTVNSLSFDSFRHTLTSVMANAGVPVEVRQKFTGHASAEMNRHYTHHEIATLRSAVSVIPSILQIRPLVALPDCNWSASKNFAGFTAAFPRRVFGNADRCGGHRTSDRV